MKPAKDLQHGGVLTSEWEFSSNNIDNLCCFNSIPALLNMAVGYKPLWDRAAVHYMDGVRSQLSPDAWRRMLSGGQAEVFGHGIWDVDSLFLLDGVLAGFKIVDPGVRPGPYFVNNYKSVQGDALEMIDRILWDEISVGKLTICEKPPRCVHALGAVPKSSGGCRPVIDASKPMYESINCFMDETFTSFRYKSLDDVTAALRPGFFMGVTDLAAAYRSALVRTVDRQHQGLCWKANDEEFYMVDNFLSFGTRAAPSIFTRITDSIARYVCASGYYCVNYLDDFLVMGESKIQCERAQLFLHGVLRDLGFYISYNKVLTPSTNQRYLGINVDSVSMQLSLPEDKMLRLQDELAFFSGRRKATRRQIQRLCGVIAHCAQMVRGGRTFSRRIIALLSKFGQKGRYITLTKSFQMDLVWWQKFAKDFNGSAKIIDVSRWKSATVVSDASGSGFGAINGKDWICGCWDREIKTVGVLHGHALAPPVEHVPDNINVQELYPVLAAVRRWGDKWRDCRVECYTDNTQVVAAVNGGVSVNLHALELLRLIFWESVKVNCHLIAHYLPGPTNVWPDYLSRISSKTDCKVPPHLCCRGGSLVPAARPESGGVEGTSLVRKHMEDEIVTVAQVH